MSVRLEKMNGLIHECVAELLLRKSKDPRLAQVNVTQVKVAPDLKRARIFYSIYGPTEDRAAVQAALLRARGFIRASLASSLTVKFVPELVFEFDRNLEYAQKIGEMLDQLTNGKTEQEVN